MRRIRKSFRVLGVGLAGFLLVALRAQSFRD